MEKLNFRKDINGLRAIAVIAVVIFHFNPNWIQGGFVGVDIFFVISGYLMSRIILNGLHQESFSFTRFYLSRANRILPALIVVCICLLIYGWFFSTKQDYSTLIKHVKTSLLFYSNIEYWQESGYFETAAKEKWLTHTWSLSVEWQFYIVYPFILWVINKVFKSKLPIALVISTIIGFILSSYITPRYPDASYYLLPTRAWEMLIGGCVFVYQDKFRLHTKKNTKRTLEAISWIAVLSSIFLLNEHLVAWPGFAAGIPVAGTAIILLCNNQKNILLTNPISSTIGKWSYSIYLWHWPFTVYSMQTGGDGYYNLIYISISCFCGALSYYLVERRRYIKNEHLNSALSHLKQPIAIIFIIPFSFISVLSYLAETDKLSNFHPGSNTPQAKYLDFYKYEYLKKISHSEIYTQKCNFYDIETNMAKNEISSNCYKNSNGIFVWGDSHAQYLANGVRSVYKDKIPYSQIATSSCPPMINENNQLLGEFGVACNRANNFIKKVIAQINPKVVILAQQRRHDQNDFFEISRYLKSIGVNSKIILVGSTPQWHPSLIKAIAMRHFSPNDKKFSDIYFDVSLFEINQKLNDKYKNSEITYVSLIDFLCTNEKCLAKVDNNNTPLVYDYGHLTEKGALYILNNLLKNKIDNYTTTDN